MNQQLIEAYKTLLEQQNSIYTIMFSVVIGIVVLLVGSSLYVSFVVSKREMKREIWKIFQDETKRIYKEIDERITTSLKSTEEKITMITAELSKNTAMSCYQDKMYGSALKWITFGLSLYIKLNMERRIRAMTQFFEKVLCHDEWIDQIESAELELESLMKTAREIPDILYTEKNEIIRRIEVVEKKQENS